MPFDQRKSELAQMDRLTLVAEYVSTFPSQAKLHDKVPTMTNEQMIAAILQREGH